MKKDLKKYEGNLFSVFERDLPNFTAEIVKHPGGIVVAAKNDNNKYLMVKQHRIAIDKTLIEFPAGKIDPREEPKETALRELKEETGYLAKNISYLGKIFPSPAYLDEVLHLFYAFDLEFVGQNLDPFEEIEVLQYSYQEIYEMIDSQIIEDAKTIALFSKLMMK